MYTFLQFSLLLSSAPFITIVFCNIIVRTHCKLECEWSLSRDRHMKRPQFSLSNDGIDKKVPFHQYLRYCHSRGLLFSLFKAALNQNYASQFAPVSTMLACLNMLVLAAPTLAACRAGQIQNEQHGDNYSWTQKPDSLGKQLMVQKQHILHNGVCIQNL